MDVETRALSCSVAQAALELGISERAVRARIEAGALFAIRHGHTWSVIIDVPISRCESPYPLPSKADVIAPNAAAPFPAAPQSSGMDVSALTDLVERLNHRIEQLTEEAAVWQTRALRAEEQLQRLHAEPAMRATPHFEHASLSKSPAITAPSGGGGIGRRSAHLQPLQQDDNTSRSYGEAGTTPQRSLAGQAAATEPSGELSSDIRSRFGSLAGWMRKR